MRLPVSCLGSLNTVSQAGIQSSLQCQHYITLLSTYSSEVRGEREIERRTRTLRLHHSHHFISAQWTNEHQHQLFLSPLRLRCKTFSSVITIIHHHCLPVFCLLITISKTVLWTTRVQHLVMQQSVRRCHSVEDRKLFNVYDKSVTSNDNEHLQKSVNDLDHLWSRRLQAESRRVNLVGFFVLWLPV